MPRLAVALFALAVLAAPAAAQAGDDDLEIAFNDHCRECHSFVKDDNRLGRRSTAWWGARPASEPGYAYSESLKEFRHHLGRGDARQMDRRSRRGDPRQRHEPALFRHHRP